MKSEMLILEDLNRFFPFYWCSNELFSLLFAAKHLELHYLLSGDADGAIILWEISLADNKVLTPQIFGFFCWLT